LSDVNILGRLERRPVWTAQEKAARLAEIDAAGGKVRLVARRHRISESVLYNRRSARKAAAVAMGAPETVEFVPVGLIEGSSLAGPAMRAPAEPEPVQQPPAGMCKAGSIEIALPNGARVSVDAFVNEKALTRVLRAMQGVAWSASRRALRCFSLVAGLICATGLTAWRRRCSKWIGNDPFSGHLFIFRGKHGDYFKGLYWDGSGLWLIAKRLEKGRFVWPPIVDGAMT
jgi:transposase-like protein